MSIWDGISDLGDDVKGLLGGSSGGGAPAAPGQAAQPQYNPNAAIGPTIGNGGDANRARMLGQTMGGASAYNPNYSGYNAAVGSQNDALGLMQGAANGTAPSAAGILGQKMVGDSLNAQLGGAASARGGSMAQASAMRQAAQGAAATQQSGAANIAALRAQEMGDARNAYANQADAMGSQSLQQTGMNIQNQQFQRGLNAQTQMGYEGMANGVDQAQAGLDQGANQFANNYGLQQQQLAQQQWQGQAALDQHATDRSTSLWSSLLGGAASGAAGSIAGNIAGKATGGPVSANTPYIVGEHGPELIVPQGPGFVYTADQTRSLLSDPRSKTGIVDMSAPMGHAPPWMPADVDYIKYGPQTDNGALLDDRATQTRDHAPPASWLEDYRNTTGRDTFADSRHANNGAPMERSSLMTGYASADDAQVPPQPPKQPKPDPFAPSGKPNPFAAAIGGFGSSLGSRGRDTLHELEASSRMHISDPRSKIGLSPIAAPVQASAYALNPGGGLDVAGTGRLMNQEELGYLKSPGAAPLVSDPAAKQDVEEIVGPGPSADLVSRLTEAMVRGASRGLEPEPSARDFAGLHSRGAGRLPEPWGDRNGNAITEPVAQPEAHVAPPPGIVERNTNSMHAAGFSPEMSARAAAYMHERNPFAGLRTQGQGVIGAPQPEEAAPAQMMDAIGGGKTFEYRPGVPGTAPGQHFGTTTEDLKKTPMGASMVIPANPGTGGYEAIDTKEAVGPTLAALGNLNQRLRFLEMTKRRGGT